MFNHKTQKQQILKIINKEQMGMAWLALNFDYDFKKSKSKAISYLIAIIFFMLATLVVFAYFIANIYVAINQKNIQIQNTPYEYLFLNNIKGNTNYLAGICSILITYMIIFVLFRPLTIRFLNYHFWLNSKNDEKKIRAIISTLLSFFEIRSALRIPKVGIFLYISIWFKNNAFILNEQLLAIANSIQSDLSENKNKTENKS